MANRFSPTVLPDSRPDQRPGLEIADAIDAFREAKAFESDRAEAATDRTRRRGREDVAAAVGDIEFDQLIRDQFGGTPVDQAGGQQTPAAAGAPQGAAGVPTPELTRPLFDQARIGLQAGARQPDPEEGEVVVLPGQFMGGDFAQQTVRMPTRTFAGREFSIDPQQTAAARAGRSRQADLESLVAAGIPEAEAVAMLRTAPGAIESRFEAPRGTTRRDDPMKGEFESPEAQAAFIDFRRQLSQAEARPGTSRPEDGPIDVEDALAELDQIYGEFDRSGNLIGHQLDERERFRLATLWSEGNLTSEQLPEPRGGAEPEAEPEDTGPGFFRRMINRIDPRVDAQGNPTGGTDADGLPAGTQQAGPLSSGAPAAASGSDLAVDSLRSIVREFSTQVDEATLREILIDQGFTAEQIAAAIGG